MMNQCLIRPSEFILGLALLNFISSMRSIMIHARHISERFRYKNRHRSWQSEIKPGFEDISHTLHHLFQVTQVWSTISRDFPSVVLGKILRSFVTAIFSYSMSCKAEGSLISSTTLTVSGKFCLSSECCLTEPGSNVLLSFAGLRVYRVAYAPVSPKIHQYIHEQLIAHFIDSEGGCLWLVNLGVIFIQSCSCSIAAVVFGDN